MEPLPFSRLEEMMLSEEKVKHTFRPGQETFRHTFRIIRFLWSLFRFEVFFIKEYKSLSERYRGLSVMMEKSGKEIPWEKMYNDLFTEGRRLTYLNIIIPVLMRVYHQRLSKRLKKAWMSP